MVNMFKQKIAEGGADLSAQQIANMNHIVINNYTNAGLSILFLFVVYSIIAYGVKVAIEARHEDKRTDGETDYVPVPAGGVKISNGH